MVNIMSMRTSICIEMIFPELPTEKRIERVAAAGFNGIEFWDWRNKNLDALASLCAEFDIAITNMSGQRAGSLVDPKDLELYENQVLSSIEAAQKISCSNLMLLTNPLDAEGRVTNTYSDITSERKKRTCIETLSKLASHAADNNIHLLLEPLNTVVDHPGYWLDDADCAFEIIRAVRHPRVRLLYDLYHMRAMGRDTSKDIEENLDLIGYVHAADFPGRHEPGAGDMDYPSIFRLLDELGYSGIVGFEFSPAKSSEEALKAIYNLVECDL